MTRILPTLCVLLVASAAQAADLPRLVFAGAPAEKLPTRLFAGWSWDDLPRHVFAQLPPAERLPASLFAQAVEDEVQDFILLSDARPLMVRVHLIVDGRGFRLPWGEFVGRVHAYLDRNSDGVLTVKETQTPNWQQMLMVGLFRGGMNNNNFTGVKIDPNGDGKVSNQELADFLRPGFGPFQAQASFEADPRAEAIFGHLDKNKDRKLTRDEVEAAAVTLLPLDQNEDEALTIGELGPFQNPFAAQQRRFANGNNNQGNVALVTALNPGEPRNVAANNILTKYDKGSGPGKPAKDRKLDRDEIGLNPVAFQLADKNKDGALDVGEITSYLTDKIQPDVECMVRVASATGEGTIETFVSKGQSLTSAAAVRQLSEESLDVDLDVDKAIIVVAKNPTQRNFDTRDFFLQNFKSADTDGNGYVDKKEIQNNFLNQIFPVADRDGDEKFTEQELIQYLDITDEAGKCRTTLSFSDVGRTLFDYLDDNHDRRLGSREIRSAWTRLQQTDRDRDGKIVAKEIPRFLRLSFGRAQTGPQFGFAGGDDEGSIAKADSPKATPIWFLQMDRNRDGDVSPREFMGSPAAFARIDTDHDGLISASEALKVK